MAHTKISNRNYNGILSSTPFCCYKSIYTFVLPNLDLGPHVKVIACLPSKSPHDISHGIVFIVGGGCDFGTESGIAEGFYEQPAGVVFAAGADKPPRVFG